MGGGWLTEYPSTSRRPEFEPVPKRHLILFTLATRSVFGVRAAPAAALVCNS